MVECDDEYWECDGLKSEITFHQPTDKPSTVTSFIYCLRLCEILAFSLRTLYSTKKAKIWSGHVGNEWQHRLVAQINSELNNWKESVPEHLKWDPLRTDPLYFDQSTAIYTVFYYVQMQIHRPLISRNTPTISSSLATCTDAARRCGHLLDVQFKRRPLALPHVVISSFTAGVILLLGVWSGQKDFDPHDDMATVQSCLHTLKVLEPTWHIAEQNTYAPQDVPQPVASTSSVVPPMPGLLATGASAELTSLPPVDSPHPPMPRPNQYYQHYAPENAGLPPTHVFSHTSFFREDHVFNGEASSHTDPSYQFPRQMEQVWSQAPTGFDLAEWDVFITNMGRTSKT
ncbi:hypothetical protein DXG03_003223 [Asterophora parasitica]|uniref:Transcription factor domain-containing protein n=1 Tax=Asterophora parasitica TaxID=117018 RepID=A0A9P7GKE5_9AGAR|nr:hypothetical protein DXG03_003223 [Asterophora parasitica]